MLSWLHSKFFIAPRLCPSTSQMVAARRFSCDPLRHVFLVILFSLLLLSILHRQQIPSGPQCPQDEPSTQEIPPIWRKLGCKTLEDVHTATRTISRRQVFEYLVEEYLAPWKSPVPGMPNIPITAALIDSMEIPLRGSNARVRLAGDGRVLYRVVQHWEKTYRLPRFGFFLDLLAKTIKRNPELRTIHAEFFLNTADGPSSTVDSISQDLGALPLLGFRSEVHYIDIPVPDPVEHGSKVTGQGYVINPTMKIPWNQKKKLAIFRGVASCIQKQHFENWHLSPRVRVSTISSRYPEFLDAGITKWIKLSHNTTVENIERTANISAKNPLTLEEQLRYRYILDVDGGLGSSRKRWMLMSGSVSFLQKSAVYQWYEPLLTKWVHFVPVDRWFRDLVENIQWAQQNDEQALRIAKSAEYFAWKFLSEDAIIEFLAILLQKYSDMQPDARHGEEPVPNPCRESPILEHGPMGCSTGWFTHTLGEKLPFGCRHKPYVEGHFTCHRPHPVNGKKQRKTGIFSPYPPPGRKRSPSAVPVYHEKYLQAPATVS